MEDHVLLEDENTWAAGIENTDNAKWLPYPPLLYILYNDNTTP